MTDVILSDNGEGGISWNVSTFVSRGRSSSGSKPTRKQNGTSPSAIVRQLIEEHYRQPVVENCLQLAERLGILGSIKGLPADLTTNPEHMAGFGRD